LLLKLQCQLATAFLFVRITPVGIYIYSEKKSADNKH
jgi:hypothetical protein